MPANHLTPALILLIGSISLPAPKAHATFSIVACDADTQQCGVAVATHNLAVGDGVPFARFGLGAGVSQFETNACHEPAAWSQLKQDGNADKALVEALDRDSACEDGLDSAFRQIGIVSINGSAAAHTGREAAEFSGHQTRRHVSVQGNGLTSEAVLEAMLSHYLHAKGPLPERLLGALEAAYAAGGQTIGVTSAALLVATQEGWPVDTDLRVDFAPGLAIEQLRAQYDAAYARQLINRARRSQSAEQKAQLASEALQRAPHWDRIWLSAARLSAQDGHHDRALQRACRFAAINPAWTQLLADEFDFSSCPPNAIPNASSAN